LPDFARAFPLLHIPELNTEFYYAFSLSLDFLYPVGYNISMITIRETEQFKTWIRNLGDRVTQAIVNARIRRISAGNFGDSKR
jgi:hypothetical protein